MTGIQQDGRIAPAGIPYAGWLIALSLSLLVALLGVSPPFLPQAGRDVVMALFSGVCHQLPDRSPHLHGIQMAVCHRCMGSYWAIPAAAVAFRAMRGWWPFRGRGALFVLVLSILPAVADWAGDVLGLWQNTPISRMATGGIFGLTAGYYLTKAIGDIVRGSRKGGGGAEKIRRGGASES